MEGGRAGAGVGRLAEGARGRGGRAARGGRARMGGVAPRRGHEHAPALGRAATGPAAGAERVQARGEDMDRAQGAQVPEGAAVLGGGGGAGTRAAERAEGTAQQDEAARQGGAAEQGQEQHQQAGDQGFIRTHLSHPAFGGCGRRDADRMFVHGLFLRRVRMGDKEKKLF